MTNLLEKRIQIVLLPLFREFVSQPPERIQSIEKKERKKERKKKTCDQNPASYVGFIVILFRIINSYTIVAQISFQTGPLRKSRRTYPPEIL